MKHDAVLALVLRIKELAWEDGLCHNPDLDEIADELQAAALERAAQGTEGQ